MKPFVKPGTLICLLGGLMAACSPSAATGLAGLPSVTVGSTPSQEPPEAILILAPGSGSKLVGQVHVEGVAASTFEQTLVLQVVAFVEDEPQILAQQPVMIEAEMGQRGPFVANVPFLYEGAEEGPGEIRVYATSPRDGGITHLASAQVTLAASGGSDVRPPGTQAERITITSPEPGAVLRGGTVLVVGVGLASFEQTLVAEIHDADGNPIGRAPITVAADDYGVRGPFSIEVAYTAVTAGPGRVVVLDPSPAFGQTLHLASVEVRIEP